MEKIWYIKVNGTPEGPFSVLDLKRDRRITPDTLVWREGFAKWVAIRYVVELKEVFTDEESQVEQRDDKTSLGKVPDREEIALDWRVDPPSYLLWLLILIVVIIYLLRGCSQISSGVDPNSFHAGSTRNTRVFEVGTLEICGPSNS